MRTIPAVISISSRMKHTPKALKCSLASNPSEIVWSRCAWTGDGGTATDVSGSLERYKSLCAVLCTNVTARGTYGWGGDTKATRSDSRKLDDWKNNFSFVSSDLGVFRRCIGLSLSLFECR